MTAPITITRPTASPIRTGADHARSVTSDGCQTLTSYRLADLIDYLSAAPGIDSVTVVRHGHLILDAVFYPFPAERAHIIHSCTKSVVSTFNGTLVDFRYRETVTGTDIRATGTPEQ